MFKVRGAAKAAIVHGMQPTVNAGTSSESNSFDLSLSQPFLTTVRQVLARVGSRCVQAVHRGAAREQQNVDRAFGSRKVEVHAALFETELGFGCGCVGVAAGGTGLTAVELRGSR